MFGNASQQFSNGVWFHRDKDLTAKDQWLTLYNLHTDKLNREERKNDECGRNKLQSNIDIEKGRRMS